MRLKIERFVRLLAVIFLTAVAFSAISCSSAKNVAPNQLGSTEDFSRRQLSNGIPVIFKQNRGSKIVVLRIVFEGGNSLLDKNMSGLENLTLDLMLRGSETYPYAKIQQFEYEKSFSLSVSSGKDYSTAGFVCIQRDLSEVLALFADCVKNPAFLESDFKQKMTEASSAIARRKSDPSGALGIALTKAAFANHPYETSASITEESYPNISLSHVKNLHKELLDALCMKIFIVGNFSDDLITDFTAKLEEAFGSLPKKAYSAPRIPAIAVTDRNTVFVANEQAGDTGYVTGIFEYPSRDSEDCIPLAVSLMYLDDLLFSQVREKAGACYSIYTGVLGGKELVGAITVYKANEKQNLKQLIYDAILSFDEETLEKKLNQYKNQYISSIFSSSQTAAGVAASVISSAEYFGSESAYLKRVERIEKLNAKQVIAAYKKYVEPIATQNAAQWVVVDSEKNLSLYDF